MKKPPPNSPPRTRKIACTVSAAALMLGVSHAATVGFNFQVDWTENNSPSYTGKPVTATAFGISPNGWENLAPLPTGYNGSQAAPGPFTTNQVISVSTSTGGLNPLPQGSITLNWSCTAANSSGFAGYGVPYGGPSPHAGDQEVYYGFLRDEANWYTSPVGGPIPYNVTITGLRSVWTNTPYAIELIAATDTGTVITNAYIGSLVNTQQVTYDVSRGVGNIGIMGGLSTMSGPWTNDSITISSAPGVTHDGSIAVAATISGFIITDKPVISMPPNPVVVSSGDTVTWSAYAVGVPPLAYQWRHNGRPIPGATTNTYKITNVGSADAGSYDLVVTNLYGSAVSPVVAVDQITAIAVNNLVLDSNPSGVERDGLATGTTWVALSGTHSGVTSFNATNRDQITVAGYTNFNSSIGTISFWIRSAGPLNTNGNPAILFDRRNNGNGLVIALATDGAIQVQTSVGADNFVSNNSSLTNGNWHQIAVVYNQALGSEVSLYIDGVLDQFNGGNTKNWSWPAGQEIELGLSHDSYWQAYNGLLDDVRFYNREFSDAEVASIFNTGALVDNNALVMRLNFDAAPTKGLELSWQTLDAVLQSASSVVGPYIPLPAVVSPYTTSFKGAGNFYRYNGHTPITIVTNPTRM